MCRVKKFGRFKFCLIIKVIGKWKRIKNQQISLGMFYFTMSETLNSQRTALDMTFLRSKAFGGLYGFQSVRETNKPQRAAFGETEQRIISTHSSREERGGRDRVAFPSPHPRAWFSWNIEVNVHFPLSTSSLCDLCEAFRSLRLPAETT